jgi:nucleotide-binding universal stress UspA family protein
MPLTYLVGYDGSRASRSATELACRLARTTTAQVLAVHAYEGSVEAARTVLDEVAAPVDRRLAEPGAPARVLIEMADRRQAALIAVGVAQRRFGRVAAGGVTGRLLFGAPCPVLVTRVRPYAGPVEVVGVAYDGSPAARVALWAAQELAFALGAHLRILAVLETPPARLLEPPAFSDYVERMRSGLQDNVEAAVAELPDGLEVGVRIREGRPGPQLVQEAANGVDLLFVGSRGYGPVRAVILGGVSAHVANTAPCPVLVVPRDAAASLITPLGAPTRVAGERWPRRPGSLTGVALKANPWP